MRPEPIRESQIDSAQSHPALAGSSHSYSMPNQISSSKPFARFFSKQRIAHALKSREEGAKRPPLYFHKPDGLLDGLENGDNCRHCRHAICVKYKEHIIAWRNLFWSGIHTPSDRCSALRERHRD